MVPVNNSDEKEIDRVVNSPQGKGLAEEIQRYSAQIADECKHQYNDNLHHNRMHDTLIQTCMAAFINPDSICRTKANYDFLTVEPLNELHVKNFDLLLYNEKEKLGIFVECKSGLSNPSKEIDDIIEKIQVLQKNIKYLEKELKTEIINAEFVICVPSHLESIVISEIERKRKNGLIPSDTFILLWGIHIFEDKLLKLSDRVTALVEGRSILHKNPILTKVLSEGIVTDTEIINCVFPSSHPLDQASTVIAWILTENQNRKQELSIFDKEMPYEFFKDEKNLPHYHSDIIGNELGDRFINEGLSKKILVYVPDENGKLAFTVGGKTIQTIIKNYQNRYVESAIQTIITRNAKIKAWDEYRRSHPSLDQF